MDLILDNYLIDAPIYDILVACKRELTNGKLSTIKDKGDWVSIPCPFHSDGKEKHNSCGVVSERDSDLEYGTFNCLACKEKGRLHHLIGACFDADDDFGKKWLIAKFGKRVTTTTIELKPIVLNSRENKVVPRYTGDEQYYQSWHPYMQKRKLTDWLIKEFNIKYNPKHRTIVFTVWNMFGDYIFSTERSVETKQYYLPKDIDKPVYLLNYIIKNNIKKVVVCEGQINALTCWSYGVPAIALFGSWLTELQRDDLWKSGIYHYVLAFDNDEAGKKGEQQFISTIGNDVLIDVVHLPPNRDVNDLSREEFDYYFKDYFELEERETN